MKMTRRALVLAALAIAGCNGPDKAPPPDPFLATLAGTWTTACVIETVGSAGYVEDMTFAGTSMTGQTRTYAATDVTCAEAPASTGSFAGTFVLGGEVTATIGTGGPSVTARAVDATLPAPGGFETLYTLVYVDTAANPDVLYMGDERVDAARDGSTPAKRPNVLQDWKPRVKQ